MNNNGKKVTLVIVTVAMVLLLAFLFRDNLASAVQCADGMRNPVTSDGFTAKYWANSAKFEASIADKGGLSVKLATPQLQAVSAALEQANKFKKTVITRFNSCAITKLQYAEYNRNFQKMDDLSKQIERLALAPTLTDIDKAELNKLVDEYVALGQQLSKNSTSQ